MRMLHTLAALLLCVGIAHAQAPRQSFPVFDGAFFGSARQTGTWLQTLHDGTQYSVVTPLVSLSPKNGVNAAAWFGGRTSDLGANQAPFPVVNCVVLVDALVTGNNTGSWCNYEEGNLTSSVVGRHLNVENSVYSLWPAVLKSPFNMNPLGGTNNLRLDCGKGTSNVTPQAQTCSSALEILNNGAKYNSGIIFADNTFVTQPDGLQNAASLAPLQAIRFHYSGTEPAWSIFYDGTDDGNANTSYGRKIELNNSGVHINAPIETTGQLINSSNPFVFIPRGSPIAGSRAGTLRRYTMNNSVQEFADATECDSYTHSPALGGNVCHYVYIKAQPGSGQLWARNLVLALDPGFQTSQFTAIGDEVDINNIAGDYGDFGGANSVGMFLNGLGKMNTAGFYLSTGNSPGGVTGTNGSLPIWYNGYVCGANATKANCFRDMSNSDRSIVVQGSHQIGIDLSDANTSSAAITLGNGSQVQGIVGRVRVNGTDTSYTSLFIDAGGRTHVGSASIGSWVSEGNVLPSIDNTYALGSNTLRWTSVFTINANIGTAVIDKITGLPGSDPHEVGKLWRASSGQLMVSGG